SLARSRQVRGLSNSKSLTLSLGSAHTLAFGCQLFSRLANAGPLRFLQPSKEVGTTRSRRGTAPNHGRCPLGSSGQGMSPAGAIDSYLWISSAAISNMSGLLPHSIRVCQIG